MDNEVNYIEVCVGVGMDQITPEYVRIPVYPEDKKRKKKTEEIVIEKEL